MSDTSDSADSDGNSSTVREGNCTSSVSAATYCMHVRECMFVKFDRSRMDTSAK